MKDRRILDNLDLTVTTSWSVSTGIWFNASLVWRWRWLSGAGVAAVALENWVGLRRLARFEAGSSRVVALVGG